ncbi:hypothetical protein EJ05DRAFT_478837 [Pseudovirgaria hyperparasitica]|uniref:Uncharacterized protein n=1 Tax=Pseudovirgaria hyperparasitica TaxID=470096 RepID=A0A6A6VWQ2_9PEZI|nr:uncharacterized protein EJ05DRAFT_478837 [Pseudovirgaria hyperparasitica]KAF2755022.1 hypothetical protein EJ05DRAFT_478837 [Pseudovirgaria hyperparasitica]
MSTPQSRPGLLYINSGIKDPATLSPHQYTQVYKDKHIPDVVATGSLHSASFYYGAADPSAAAAATITTLPYLVLYHFDDLAHALTSALPAVPLQYSGLPGSGRLPDLAHFDTRSYALCAHNKPHGVAFGTSTVFVFSKAGRGALRLCIIITLWRRLRRKPRRSTRTKPTNRATN